MRDIRVALRTLRRSPAYALSVVLTLALGIGAATAAYSVYQLVVVKPLPYAAPDRVMMVAEEDSAGNVRPVSYPTFLDWKQGTHAFESLAFARGRGAIFRSGETSERLVAAYVSDEFFEVVPGHALAGRTLDPADNRPGAPGAVVLSWSLWQRRFAGDRGILGRSITLDDRAYTVAGIMPASFIYPTWAGLWVPVSSILGSDPALGQRGVHVDTRVVGRLRAGVDSAAGVRDLSAVAARLADAYPAETGGWRRVAFQPVAEEILGGSGPSIRLLAFAAVFVLLIACVNVAGLTLARAGARSRELAIRLALGGGRAALLRLLIAESVVLWAAAGALGVLLAFWLIELLRLTGSELLPRTDELAVNPVVLMVAVAAALGLIVGFGILPVVRRTGTLTTALREGLGAGIGRARGRLRAGLVVGEIALALVLLTGAGLLLRSLERLERVPTGFDQDRLLSVPVVPISPRYDAPERALQLYRDVAEAVAGVAGVQSVALTNYVPLSGASMTTAIKVDGVAPSNGGSEDVLFREVDSAYFQTLGIPVLRGRAFTGEDVAHPGNAVLVNQTFARRFLAGVNPIGHRVTLYKSTQGRADFGEAVNATVIGVVGDVRHFSLDTDFVPELYVPYTLTAWTGMEVVVRAGGEPDRLIPAITRAVRKVDPDLPLDGSFVGDRIYPVEEALRMSLVYRRFITGLLGAFALPAVLLAALGIYGIVAYLVALRQRELGVRMALGAQQGDILRLVLGEGLKLAAIGAPLGVIGAAVATRWLRSELYEVSAMDPITLAGAAIALVAIAGAASVTPARRAMKIDPARAVQTE